MMSLVDTISYVLPLYQIIARFIATLITRPVLGQEVEVFPVPL